MYNILCFRYQNSKVKTTYWLENNSTNFTPKAKRNGNNIYNKYTRTTDGSASCHNTSHVTSINDPSNNNKRNNDRPINDNKKKNKFNKNKKKEESIK